MEFSRRSFFCTSVGMGLAARCPFESPRIQAGEGDLTKAVYHIHPVGRIRNAKGKPVQLEIFEKYVPALDGLEQWSEVTVLWWFHKNDTPRKRAILKVNPKGNPKNPLTGVFATHSPVRPNLIALTICKILSVKGGIVAIDKIDAFDGTPILDLKSSGTKSGPPWEGRK